MEQGFFLLFAAAAVITALAVVLARNPVHSAQTASGRADDTPVYLADVARPTPTPASRKRESRGSRAAAAVQ